MAFAHLSLAAVDMPPQPQASFKSKIAFSAKDSLSQWSKPLTAPKSAPNVILILLDDVGFSAASTFGGAVLTPELDRLATQGLRYNNFHVTGICSPTRAALLSGRNHHRMGFGTVVERASDSPHFYPPFHFPLPGRGGTHPAVDDRGASH